MRTLPARARPSAPLHAGPRVAWADNLKVILVAGVVVAHTTMAWTGFGTWVFREPVVREPLLTALVLLTAVAATFGMPLFFLVAGYFTPGPLARKGPSRFVADRALRLLLPMIFFAVVLSPPIEFVDADNAGWPAGFREFVPHALWPPAPGPTWFLGVLFAFSVAYAAMRAAVPVRAHAGEPPRMRHLVVAALAVAAAAFPIMAVAPLGEEVWHLSVAQAPAWLAGFSLGVLARERGWLPLGSRLAHRIRWTAWLAIFGCVMVFALGTISGMDMDLLLGGGTWQSGVLAVVQGMMVVFVSLWVVDVFQGRFDRQRARGRQLSRAAYGAFLVHQGVLVLLVLGSHQLSWPREASYLAVSLLGVVLSFAVGALLARVPGVRRIV